MRKRWERTESNGEEAVTLMFGDLRRKFPCPGKLQLEKCVPLDGEMQLMNKMSYFGCKGRREGVLRRTSAGALGAAAGGCVVCPCVCEGAVTPGAGQAALERLPAEPEGVRSPRGCRRRSRCQCRCRPRCQSRPTPGPPARLTAPPQRRQRACAGPLPTLASLPSAPLLGPARSPPCRRRGAVLAAAPPSPPPRPSPVLLILWVKEPALALFCLGGVARWVKGTGGRDGGSGCWRPEGRSGPGCGRGAKRRILWRRVAKLLTRPRRFCAAPAGGAARRRGRARGERAGAGSPAPAGNFPQPAPTSPHGGAAPPPPLGPARWGAAPAAGGTRRWEPAPPAPRPAAEPAAGGAPSAAEEPPAW